MKKIFITGLSGTGKSSVLDVLRERGFTAIDTDYDDWCELSTANGEEEYIWNEDKMQALLTAPQDGPLFVSGCVSNQGKFSAYFDHKILFTAPLEVMRERLLSRTSNVYGKSEAEWAEICGYHETVLPLLEKGTDMEIDTTVMDAETVANFLVGLC